MIGLGQQEEGDARSWLAGPNPDWVGEGWSQGQSGREALSIGPLTGCSVCHSDRSFLLLGLYIYRYRHIDELAYSHSYT